MKQSYPTFTIQPSRGLRLPPLKEIFEYRELVYFLTWRDIKIRYKQTAIGVLWVILQPLAMMLVFSLFFGRLAKIDQYTEVSYSLFAFAGLLPWQFFARTLNESNNSLISQQRLITKVYFPRIIVPMTTCFAAFFDFMIGALLLAVFMLCKGVCPGVQLIFLPFFIGLMVLTALGVAFWISALNSEYRDMRHMVPFMVQFWMFVTPVVYPSSILPAKYRYWLGLNPMTGVVEGIRWSLFGDSQISISMLIFSTCVALVVFCSGLVWFGSRERYFIDSLGGQ